MKKAIYFLYFCLSIISVSGQEDKYKFLLDENGIQVFAKELECHDNQNGIHQQYYALQFINNTNEFVTITWNIDIWMNGACVTCNTPKNSENTYILQLQPEQIFEADCNKQSPKGTKIYIRELNNPKSSVLSKFEIVNLQVNFN